MDADLLLENVDITLLAGPSLRTRFLADVESAERSLVLMTADLKLAQMGRRRDLVDVLVHAAGRGVDVQILSSSTTGNRT